MKLLFVVSITLIICFGLNTAYTDQKGVKIFSIENKIDFNDLEVYDSKQVKAIQHGEPVDYYAASFERCDDLYKYCHCIGKGYVEGFKNEVYLIYMFQMMNIG